MSLYFGYGWDGISKSKFRTPRPCAKFPGSSYRVFMMTLFLFPRHASNSGTIATIRHQVTWSLLLLFLFPRHTSNSGSIATIRHQVSGSLFLLFLFPRHASNSGSLATIRHQVTGSLLLLFLFPRHASNSGPIATIRHQVTGSRHLGSCRCTRWCESSCSSACCVPSGCGRVGNSIPHIQVTVNLIYFATGLQVSKILKIILNIADNIHL